MILAFPERLRQLRLNANMTQLQLSQETGLSNHTLSSYERGATIPGIREAIILADYFNVTLDDLICREPKKKKKEVWRYG